MTLATAAAVAAVPAPLRLTPRNVVCVTRITDALDLPALAAAIDGADYNPKTFPGMIVRMSNPRADTPTQTGRVIQHPAAPLSCARRSTSPTR